MSGSVKSVLNDFGILSWCVRILHPSDDPEPDDEYKALLRNALSGTIVFSDGEWLASYKLMDNGDVLVDFIIRDSDAL